jgi:hypothetical protein
MYDSARFMSFARLGIDISSPSPAEPAEFPTDVSGQVRLIANPFEFEMETISGLLDSAPAIVDRKPVRATRKAADPLAILAISVPVTFLVAFAKRSGEKTADAFWSWLSRVFKEIARHKRERVLFEFVSAYKGCRVEFVVDSKDTAVLCEASAGVSAAAQSAKSLVDHLHEQGLTKLVYGFDTDTGKWLPRYATSNRVGVITDRPYPIAVEQRMGVSFGGIIPEE